MRRPTRFPTVLGGVLALVAGLALAQAPDLAEAPIPDLADVHDDERRALVVEVRVQEGSAELLDSFVTETPPGVHVGDPAQLHIRWYDAAGIRIGGRNAWDPRWEYRHAETGEELVVLPEGVGALEIPLSGDIVTVSVTELASGLELLRTDVRNTVETFCLSTPDDPNCAGFDGGDPDDDGGGVDGGIDDQLGGGGGGGASASGLLGLLAAFGAWRRRR